ncbi:MAG TPA: hypothetical protein VIL36_06945 [Acidimicrobiales bacterium]
MNRRIALCFLLLLGLLVGITVEPDSGTPANLGRPDVTASTVGANHAKPLPSATSVDEIARTTIVTLVAGLLMALLGRAIGILLRRPDDEESGRPPLGAGVPARRGPPVPAIG